MVKKALEHILSFIRTRPAISSLIAGFVVLCIVYLCCLPRDLFEGTTYSKVLTDRNGELLNAKIAEDGQWRFPPSDSVPEKFCTAITTFEDRWFRWHPGVNPVSLARAAYQNLSSGMVVSGGSTITMQVIRLSRNRERTVWQKMTECILATRLELRCSKDEIMALYAAHAPFGGNVVGLEAASWRYFGKPASELSWAETSTLAVLPNAPALIHPGRNRDLLKQKRDRLLQMLYDRGEIDSTDLALARDEPLPDKPLPLPQYAPHLADSRYLGLVSQKGHGDKPADGAVATSIDIHIQKQMEAILERWSSGLNKKGIEDLAAVVFDVRTMEVIAYCGNTFFNSGRPGCQVDILQSPRSTGSILKPLLYCAMLQEGTVLPGTILPDIPVNINGFSPQNYDLQFYGAVPADEALARSLNVPAVHMLRKFGVPKFYSLLRNSGMTSLYRSPENYGLSLILGGAEGRLFEITEIYARLAHLLAYTENSGEDIPHARIQSDLLDDSRFPLTDREAIWWTMDALKEVNRPDEMDWRLISSVRKTAWKTGTSYGFRDAWAVGVTPEYAIGVWAGNADGEGVPGLSGATAAGPVMFDLFNALPSSGKADSWFAEPDDEQYCIAEVCRQSGHLSGQYCEARDTLFLPEAALRSEVCPYHMAVTVSQDGKFRTTPAEPGARTVSMFILPPAMEWYYRQHHPEYKALPPYRPGQTAYGNAAIPMGFIYPENGSTITIPRQLDGSIKGAAFNLAHSNPETEVFWHLDSEYLGSTKYIHQMNITASKGEHTVTVVDTGGNTLSVRFFVK